MSSEEHIFFSEHNDEEMLAAKSRAQETFKYFWRELSWERRRIIPGLDLASVKVVFTDQNVAEGEPDVEHMWIDEVDFDGEYITGFLINKPNWLRNISEGDHVKAKISDISDWMFAVSGRVYGAFSVNLLRSRMSQSELKSHDQAWGLDFGNPNHIDLVYVPRRKGMLAKLLNLKGQIDPEEEQRALIEHPMSLNMGQSLIDELSKSDELIHSVDDNGWTTLHSEALAGNLTSVVILLEHGADKTLRTKSGKTALDLARSLNWDHVVDVLTKD